MIFVGLLYWVTFNFFQHDKYVSTWSRMRVLWLYLGIYPIISTALNMFKKTRKSHNTMCKVAFNHQPVYLFGWIKKWHFLWSILWYSEKWKWMPIDKDRNIENVKCVTSIRCLFHIKRHWGEMNNRKLWQAFWEFIKQYLVFKNIY